MNRFEQLHALLSQKPRANLGFFPTPLYKLDRLSERLGVNLYVKRDDFSGMSLFGGNKIRKLEYLLGDAKEKGCDTVFTYGATQSNHAMQTVTACRRLGMEPILYLNAYALIPALRSTGHFDAGCYQSADRLLTFLVLCQNKDP